MSYRDLSNASMTIVTNDWLNPDKERPLLLGLTRVAPLLGDLEDAHRDLLDFQNYATRLSPEMIGLNEKAAALDARHDRQARGIHDLLASLAELADDPNDAALLLTVKSEIFPQGKLITNRSYLDQAGEAELVEKRLSERSKKLLEVLVVCELSLETYVSEWRKTARALGEVEKERLLLAQANKAAPQLSIGKVRIAWIRAVKDIVAMLARETELSEADRRRILEPLETALAKAAKRKAASTAKDAAPSEPAHEDLACEAEATS